MLARPGMLVAFEYWVYCTPGGIKGFKRDCGAGQHALFWRIKLKDYAEKLKDYTE